MAVRPCIQEAIRGEGTRHLPRGGPAAPAQSSNGTRRDLAETAPPGRPGRAGRLASAARCLLVVAEAVPYTVLAVIAGAGSFTHIRDTGRGHALTGRALYMPEGCAADEEHRELASVPETNYGCRSFARSVHGSRGRPCGSGIRNV
jgi:hypothetical protein